MRLVHVWLESLVEFPLVFDFGLVFPESNGETCQVGSTECSRFTHFRTLDRNIENVRLELHEEVVADGPTIDAERLQVDA